MLFDSTSQAVKPSIPHPRFHCSYVDSCSLIADRATTFTMSSLAPSTALATQQHLSLPLHTSFLSSHALHWPCSQASQPKTFVLFIPGNPGLVNYYIPYLTGIYNAQGLRGKVEILAVGHRGHSRVPMGGGGGSQGGISLEDQTRQKVDVVRAIRSVYPKAKAGGSGRDGATDENGEQDVKLVLIGHSVGAYISLKVMEQLGDQIDGAQLLFPTVMDIARTPKGSSLPLTVSRRFMCTVVAAPYLLTVPRSCTLPLVLLTARNITPRPRPRPTSSHLATFFAPRRLPCHPAAVLHRHVHHRRLLPGPHDYARLHHDARCAPVCCQDGLG